MTWMRTLKRPAALVGAVLVTGAFAPAAEAQDPVIAASGDQVCGTDIDGPPVTTSSGCRQNQTANILDQIRATRLDAVLPLGDVQYECGELSNFNTFYTPSWGRSALKVITRPVIGNHEYRFADGTNECLPVSQGGNESANGRGYYTYFGSAIASPLDPGCVAACKGYYSYDLGNWHLIALNSNCSRVGGCNSTSPQANWLRSDLADNAGKNCFLAYWHAPRWSSGGRQVTAVHSLWEILRENNADVVLTGHDHTYERFGKLGKGSSAAVDPVPDPNGIREWVVGVGGRNFTSFTTIRQVSEVRDRSAMGVLKLTLKNNSYDWQFVPEAGKTFTDSGSAACNGAATEPPAGDKTPPTVTAQSPTPGATGVAAGTDVTATFSETVQGVSGATFQVAPDATPNQPVAAAQPTVSGNTWTLNPSSNLAPDTLYRVTLTGGTSAIRDAAENALQTTSWTFRTAAAAGDTPPTVTAQSPTPGATGVAAGTDVTATFSETVQGVSGATFQVAPDATPNQPVAAAQPTVSGNTWTLNPSSNLAPDTLYRVTLTGGASAIRDAAGNALQTTSWTFRTAAGGGQPTTRTVTLSAVADTMVKQAAATTSFGTTNPLQADSRDVDTNAASAVHSYIRFDIPALAAGETITDASLSLMVAGSSATSSASTTDGPAIWRTATNWTDTTMTWNSRLLQTGTGPVGNFVNMPGAARSTTAVSGITAAGPVSFVLVPESTNGLDFRSLEQTGTSDDPQLILTIAG